MALMDALNYATEKAGEGKDLLPSEATAAMMELISNQATELQIASFLTAMHEKTETADELAAFAMCLREVAARTIDPVLCKVNRPLIDTCGTGGGTVSTFNISTAVGFVLASCGLCVAKHGNRAITSQTGSADVLESLGISVALPMEKVIRCIEEIGIGFLFAPAIHSATARVQPVRRRLPHKTFFNLLGPLTNPLSPEYQVIGVYAPETMITLGGALRQLGSLRAMVVHGLSSQPGDSLDEASLLGETLIREITPEAETSYHLDPREYGFKLCEKNTLSGGTANQNAGILQEILSGKDKGPRADIVALNAALGLIVSGKSGNFQEALGLVRDVLASGKAYQKVEQLRDLSRRL